MQPRNVMNLDGMPIHHEELRNTNKSTQQKEIYRHTHSSNSRVFVQNWGYLDEVNVFSVKCKLHATES